MTIPKIIPFVFAIVITGMVPSDTLKEWSEDRPLAYVQRYKPNVEIQNEPKHEQAQRGGPLFDGDTLHTGEHGYALVQFMDKSLARVKPNSILVVHGEVKSKNNTPVRIGLEFGEIFLNVSKRSKSNFQVATTTSIASVKGTRFGARDDNYFWVEEGSIELLSNSTGQAELLTEKMYGRVQGNGEIDTGELSDRELKELGKDYEELEVKLQPKTIKMHFRDENGEIKEIELEYFEN